MHLFAQRSNPGSPFVEIHCTIQPLPDVKNYSTHVQIQILHEFVQVDSFQPQKLTANILDERVTSIYKINKIY